MDILSGAIRVQLNSLMQTDQNDSETQHLVTELRNQLELKRTEYRDSYSSLKELKPRVEHLQHSLELAKMRLVQDFESWWNQMSIEQSDDNISHQQRNESNILNSLNNPKNLKVSKIIGPKQHSEIFLVQYKCDYNIFCLYVSSLMVIRNINV